MDEGKQLSLCTSLLHAIAIIPWLTRATVVTYSTRGVCFVLFVRGDGVIHCVYGLSIFQRQPQWKERRRNSGWEKKKTEPMCYLPSPQVQSGVHRENRPVIHEVQTPVCGYAAACFTCSVWWCFWLWDFCYSFMWRIKHQLNIRFTIIVLDLAGGDSMKSFPPPPLRS